MTVPPRFSMSTRRYPQTLYEPGPLVGFTCRAERERLSPAAIRAFLNIVRVWDICEEDARELLGGVSAETFDEMRDCVPGSGIRHTLGSDQLLRISLLVGVFEGLGTLHDKELADRWVHLPNTNRIFDGHTPLAFMIHGGLPAIQTVRRLLDGRRSGF